VKLGYHSPQMAEVSGAYLGLLSNLHPDTSDRKRTTMVSSVNSAVVMREDACRGDYWWRNMVSPVDFLGAM
jgi:acyl transferase domain-containing protein